ncbi:MAG: thioredoxin domain-containing protein [Rhodothermales bacterium]|nr:thioredoxin domain-containing protein [Rhodothermales bacterium]MBO6779717.1 thioredoxin domain-containing protein [Rhodothermales bacterium]
MNRLQDAKSPYLLQHQHNPVDWFPWGDEAFEEARRRDVPIFLSIGYATCHWCHVMERESFEDDEVAALMNRHVVSIKVDREERPDIDDVYMTVCHLMGKQGGWPLTILMTPEKRPFYAATYLPKQTRFGRMGMMDLIPRVSALWREDRERIEASAADVVQVLERQADPQTASGSGTIEPAWLDTAFRELTSRYDATHGGFGSAPKFPSPHNLTFLFRYGREPGVTAAHQTILSMWRGGVFDQVGFGFHRYSTDVEWRLPHFEKMLHDQATMLQACVEGWLATGDDLLREVGLQTAEYVLRDLRHPDGGFYSAEDADSEGEEGRFYVWSEEELKVVLGTEAAKTATAWFGTRPEGNFLEEATRELTGTNVLHPASQDDEPVDLPKIRARLLEARDSRVRPLRDEKVLMDWNGLMIGAMARAGRVWQSEHLVEAAAAAHTFLRTNLREPGGWQHRWFAGHAGVAAMLDDYAFTAWGLLELFQATSDPQALDDAAELTEAMLAHCSAEGGGFYRSSTQGEALLVRKQEWYDGAMPAGVSAALGVLLDLGRLLSRPIWLERAANLIGAAAPVLGESPGALTGFLAFGASQWRVAREVVVVAQDQDDALVAEARRSGELAFWLPASGERRSRIEQVVPGVAGMGLVQGKAAAYVCRDFSCDRPVTTKKDLRAALGDTEV